MSTVSSRSMFAGHSSSLGGTSHRWFQILACLQDATCTGVHDFGAPRSSMILKDVLSSAIESVVADEQWNVSGVPELLVRAREMAESGCASAWRMAVSLLDFHAMVERYKGKVALGKRASDDSDSQDDTVSDAALSEPSAKRRRVGDNDESCSNNSSVSSDGSEFAVPDLPCQRRTPPSCAPTRGPREHSANSSPYAGSPQQAPAPASPLTAPSQWSGVLRHRHHGMMLDLAAVDVRLPLIVNGASSQLPLSRPELVVSHLVSRATVKIGSHHSCRTSFQRATAEQLAKLQSLAEHELVAVAPLGAGGALVLVPYLDNTKALRGVSFLLNSAPALKR